MKAKLAANISMPMVARKIEAALIVYQSRGVSNAYN